MKHIYKILSAFFLIGFFCTTYAASPAPKTPTCHKDIGPINTIYVHNIAHLNIYLEAKKDYLVTAGANADYCNTKKIQLKNGALYLKGPAKNTITNIYVEDLDHLNLYDVQDVSIKALSHTSVSINLHNTFATLIGDFFIPVLNVHGTSDLSTLMGKFNIAQLHYDGSGKVIINNLQANHMQIFDKGTGEVFLTGKANIRQIHKDGKGYLYINGLLSKKTRLYASGQGEVRISGITNTLRAEVAKFAFLNAKYLHSKDAFIKAYGTSLAYVKPIHQLFAYASDCGQINYFHKPTLLYKNTSREGVILPMY